jgi:hypothetical protein
VSSLVTLTFKDVFGKEIFWGSLSAIPRKGETVYIGTQKYWVERIEWKLNKNTVHKGRFSFEGVDVILDTACKPFNRKEKVTEK